MAALKTERAEAAVATQRAKAAIGGAHFWPIFYRPISFMQPPLRAGGGAFRGATDEILHYSGRGSTRRAWIDGGSECCSSNFWAWPSTRPAEIAQRPAARKLDFPVWRSQSCRRELRVGIQPERADHLHGEWGLLVTDSEDRQAQVCGQ